MNIPLQYAMAVPPTNLGVAPDNPIIGIVLVVLLFSSISGLIISMLNEK